jgi:uncharacterized protein (DUF2062 family)
LIRVAYEAALKQSSKLSETVSSESLPPGNQRRQEPTEARASRFRKRFIEPFVSSKNPPWFDALGVALGLFIGLGIPLGAQMVFLGLLRLALRFNVVKAFVFTWVNNPISVIPMYYGYYVLGSLLIGKPAVMSVADFRELMEPVLSAHYFWGSAHAFIVLGKDLLMRWFLAAVSIAAPTAIIGYLVGYRVQRARCLRRAEKLGITYRKLLQQLEKK